MKKIVFVTEGLYRGGVETTLLNWIETIDLTKYRVSVLLNNKEGDLLQCIPQNIQVVEIPELCKYINGNYKERWKHFMKSEGIYIALLFLIKTILYKMFCNRGKYYGWILKHVKKYPEKFDYAISYTMPDSICTGYVQECMEAEHKWMWCHIDVDFYHNHELDGMEKFFEKYDKIINVSECAKTNFEKKYENLKQKSCCIYNRVDVQKIMRKAKEIERQFDKSDISFLTVGRIDAQKGQDMIIDVACILRALGYNFKWYLVGPKADIHFYDRLEKRIDELHLKERIIYLGETANPYGYMAQCDVYVQPSRYEGYCTTVTEAKYLCKPIVMTNVSGADEQIRNYENGIITEKTIEGLYKGISDMLNLYGLRSRIVNNLKKERYYEQVEFDVVISKLGM